MRLASSFETFQGMTSEDARRLIEEFATPQIAARWLEIEQAFVNRDTAAVYDAIIWIVAMEKTVKDAMSYFGGNKNEN